MKQKLLPTQCYKVAELFKKAIAKSLFNVLSLQLRISNLNEKGSLPLALLLNQSTGTVPQAGRCSEEFCQS